MTINHLLAVAAQAYAVESSGLTALPKTYEEARQHTSGDSLADFIVIELTEALCGESQARLTHRAVDVLLSARNQLDAVIDAIQQAADPPQQLHGSTRSEATSPPTS